MDGEKVRKESSQGKAKEMKKHKRNSSFTQDDGSWWLKINPAPSEFIIHAEYERWMKEECLTESERYIRTLAGTVIGADSTIKAAKKVNIYKKTEGSTLLKISNLLEGGLLTLVNANIELVSWQFLFTNLILESIKAIRESGQQNEVMGIPFNEEGEMSRPDPVIHLVPPILYSSLISFRLCYVIHL
ncbi:hypothetical protein M422DRAFT_272032 [Sphaerobolus stellatus SS14]|uniref:Uncharacterized protein n=1 Tax=Sphaerobolus stellatus (strain SS14) TaxID=990650 RepID=A0A0C9TYC4_SPHS4|nr:hypothetical protein M422DRAFT_272032 [Sphaerobolus stellatus SS14]